MITHINTCFAMIKDKVKKYWPFYLFFAIVISFLVISLYSMIRFSWNYNKRLYDRLMSVETKVNDNTMTIPEGSQVYIVQPQGEQEVIVIGDPDDITVKPKKRTNK